MSLPPTSPLHFSTPRFPLLQVTRHIAEGGSANVYLATTTSNTNIQNAHEAKQVAVKVMNVWERGIERAKEEIQIMVHLSYALVIASKERDVKGR